jgi:hypothetical protein
MYTPPPIASMSTMPGQIIGVLGSFNGRPASASAPASSSSQAAASAMIICLGS